MKSITLRMSDTDHAALTARAAGRRQSAAKYLLTLVDIDLASLESVAASAKPKPGAVALRKASEDAVRPSNIRNPLIERGWSAAWLDTIPRAMEYQLFANNQMPGPDGTASYVQTDDEVYLAKHAGEFKPETVARVMAAQPKSAPIVVDAQVTFSDPDFDDPNWDGDDVE